MSTYIHELNGWPAFRWDEKLLAQRLADVRHRQGLLSRPLRSRLSS